METVKYSLISKQDIKLGTGTFEITLADGRVVSVDEIDIGKLLEQYPIKSYATTAVLPTTGVAAGSLARVDADSGLYIYANSAWVAVGGVHNHAASEITSGQLAVARGGTGADFSAAVQGTIFYVSATGVISALSPGSANQFLKTQGASANPTWGNVSENIVPFQASADVTVANSAAETNLVNETVGASTLIVGTTLRLTMRGKISVLNTANCTFRFKWGATTMVSMQIFGGTTTARTDLTYRFVFELSDDNSLTAQIAHVHGVTEYTGTDADHVGFGSAEGPQSNIKRGTAAENAATALNMTVSAQWSGASASNSVTMEHYTIENLQ